MKKKYFALLFLIGYYPSCAQQQYCKNAGHILEQSAIYHDPEGSWNTAKFKLHIEEPRTESPLRYSILTLDRGANYFSLDRNREEHISSHIVDRDGQAKILWDGGSEIAQEHIEKYKLDPKSNFGFKRFYQLMYGLPMSLQQESMTLRRLAKVGSFQNTTAYIIETELQRPMISKNWRIFFSTDDYRLLGAELYSKEEPGKGERIIFLDSIKVEKLLLPRMRHWYTLQEGYLGSDIIVNEIQ